MIEQRLEIAGIKCKCLMPYALLNDSIVKFTVDSIENTDINIAVSFRESIEEPYGSSITNEILEWYVYENEDMKYRLVKRDDINDKIIISMQANYDWSDVQIKLVPDNNDISIDIFNVLFFEIIFRNRVFFHDGIVVHSSSIYHKGKSVLFSAPSGTGKSTHVGLWEKYHEVAVLNDDHPVVRLIDGKPYVFGTPWAGERKKFTKDFYLLDSVVILEQGMTNEIMELDNNGVVKEFLPRCFLPYYNSQMVTMALDIFKKIVTNIRIFKLKCKPDYESVSMVKDAIWND